jgi:hypothetical protein
VLALLGNEARSEEVKAAFERECGTLLTGDPEFESLREGVDIQWVGR